MKFLFILRYIFLSIGALSFLTIPLLLKLQKRERDNIKVEDQFFLIFLLMKRLNEELAECKGLISQKNYNELKKTIDKIQTDFFGK